MAASISSAAAVAATNAVVDLVDAGAGAGVVNIYAGSVPADLDTAISGQTLLVAATMADPAFGDAVAGATSATATAASIAAVAAAASGTPSFFRVADSNGTEVFQGTAGTSGTDMLVDGDTAVGVNFTVSSLTYTHPEAGT